MKNLAIFYGGKSVEHDISIITAINLLSNVDKKKYNVFPVYIDKNNNWKILKNYMNISSYICQPSGVFLVTGFYNKYLVKKGAFGLKRLAKIDVAINCCHGAYGEDGSLSGLLKLAGIPLVGSGVLASSVGMDKAMMKDVFVANGIPCPKYYYFTEMDYNIHKYELMNKLEADIEYPMIVKPSGLGSSIGINISKNRQDLINNVEIALKFDKKVIVESVIENLREINCSVIGNYNEVRTSILEEPKNWKTFLNFDEKYLNFDSSKKQIDVHINQQIDDQIRQLAIKCFKLLGCSGVVTSVLRASSRPKKPLPTSNTLLKKPIPKKATK